jgi:hypothetical protein
MESANVSLNNLTLHPSGPLMEDDDCGFDCSESSTESESTTFDDEEDLSDSSDSSSDPSMSLDSIGNVTTPKEKSNGLFLSLEMVQFLRKSTSEGNVAAASMIPQELIDQMTPSTYHQQAGVITGLPRNSSIKYFQQPVAVREFHGSPKETLEIIMKAQGMPIQYHKCTDVPANYFVKCSVSSSSFHLMTAVRQNDLATIRYLHEVEGHDLQCSNKFQESLVHTVARRGLPEILSYLRNVAGVSLRVCCDGGRNALHDACWTGSPNFELIDILVHDSPDLLYIMDKRNFTPLDYIPKEAYDVWNEWLNINTHFLLPRVLS